MALPQPLTPSEAVRIRHVLSLQDSGNVAEAARETERLENPLLLGSILADRYLRASYRPTGAELSGWLARFGDQPDAVAIQTLLSRLAPDPRARDVELPSLGTERVAGRGRRSSNASQARSLFIGNRDADALAAAQSLLSRPAASGNVAEPLLAGGLAALRLNEIPTARVMFEAAYRQASTQSQRAETAFWTARAEQRRHDRGGVTTWLRLAAQEGGTFYGAIARRALGPSLACTTGDTIGSADVDALLATPAGKRAFGLLQIGEKRLAEAELRTLWLDAGQDPTYGRPLFLIARAVGLSQLAAEVQAAGPAYDHRADGAAPPRLHPDGGFIVDPALVYALVRHESNFRPSVVSRSGARGLMQIMPVTARSVGAQPGNLHDPAANLAIGQLLLVTLAEDNTVAGDLLRLLAGYSQGLYAMKRWADTVRDDGDPLMFLEAIPNPRTRAYIEEALSYSWHYARELHVPTASLDALAAGRAPRLVRAGERVAGTAACARRPAAR